jgi:hypothetical protein
MVKDCYIMPLSSDEQLHHSLHPIDGHGLGEAREDILLAIIVRTKRKRPGSIDIMLTFYDRIKDSDKIDRVYSLQHCPGLMKYIHVNAFITSVYGSFWIIRLLLGRGVRGAV